ncbi:MAG: hypothetical protein A2Y62_01730 [Candidatus Fischerbacteria bacterium RBG_13_37_8]|uniref:histidine kinase n=1 Tax=Candidatus Fischerbacteria bacterium RBG_13_37_8 TaxID=1817863 RepID=A0A1F5VDL0_9BACT|nr:MAG: hypothetical protein A2Y62_01730 [Candidatus Fischerbacteria bacterium RBG_13_37_8]
MLTIKKLKLLIIESSGDDAMRIVRLLELNGYQVTWTQVQNAPQLNNALHNESWDIIISDYLLPGFNAFDALQIVKESGFDIPFILVSGEIGDNLALKAVEKGARDYVMKSNSSRLVSIVEREIGSASARENHKITKEALNQSEEKYRLLVENANEAIVVAQDGKLIFCNRKTSEITGYSNDELMKMLFMELIYHEDREMVLERHKKRLNEEELPYLYPFRIINKNSQIKWVEINAIVINWDKKPATLNFLLDITERVRIEQEKEKLQKQFYQAQKLEAIATLTSGITHDYNNLLTAAMGNVELLRRHLTMDEKAAKFLENLHYSCRCMANLTRQLLLFSRKEPIQVRNINLNQLIINLLKMIDRLIGEDITLTTQLTDDLWLVGGDSGNFEQVIMNLIVNARDAMPNGGSITISTHNVILDEDRSKFYGEVSPGRYVCFSVTDTGTGINNETIQHIFEPFFTTKERGYGTGLGLAVVHGIIKQHNGGISIYSEPGKGTTFKIYLPACLETRSDESEFIPCSEDLSGNGKRILLVEDDAGVRNVTRIMLTASGYHVFPVANAKDAFELFKKENGNFDLVFSDVVLPDESGLDLIEKLCAIKPSLKMLLASGYTDNKSRWKIIIEKGYPYINKPYVMNELLSIVKKSILDS